MKLTIYTDGASRGNPGPSAIAFLIADDKGKLLKSHKHFIGQATNNIAEYRALIAALERASKLGDEVSCFSDSKLMISQLRGEFKVKKPHIKELHQKVKALEKKFKKTEYSHVPRTNPAIMKADAMVNEVLGRFA
jgi:ribonuclease HI